MKFSCPNLLISGLIPLAVTSCNSSKKENKPNVILVIADDMGYGDLGLYGQTTLSTPHIDKMAAEGMFFTNMYTGSTVCAPSRACLLTGKDTGHSSVRGNAGLQKVGDDELTLAKIFSQAGYTTGAIGKWGMGTILPPDDPQRKGFEYFYGYINMWHAHNFYPEYLYLNGERVPLNNQTRLRDGVNPWYDSLRDGMGVAEVRNEYAPYLFREKSLSFIEENKDNKFFLYLAFNTPHANNEARPDGMEVHNYYEFANLDWPEQEKGFAAMIRDIDTSVGAILVRLKELNLDKNTLVLFCSDNGPHQEGGHKVDFFDSNGDLRGMKRDMYEGGIKTPFIAWWPGTIESGTRSDEVFAFWDFLPSFADLTGVTITSYTDGISFMPTLLGKRQKEKHDHLYWEFYERGGKQAILKDNWKAVRLNVRDTEQTPVTELFDLSVDPEEIISVAQQYPERVAEMEKLFVSSRVEFESDSLFRK
jgi:arylsulfatase A-like enzyme